MCELHGEGKNMDLRESQRMYIDSHRYSSDHIKIRLIVHTQMIMQNVKRSTKAIYMILELTVTCILLA